jgi:hypothetical protein
VRLVEADYLRHHLRQRRQQPREQPRHRRRRGAAIQIRAGAGPPTARAPDSC